MGLDITFFVVLIGMILIGILYLIIGGILITTVVTLVYNKIIKSNESEKYTFFKTFKVVMKVMLIISFAFIMCGSLYFVFNS